MVELYRVLSVNYHKVTVLACTSLVPMYHTVAVGVGTASVLPVSSRVHIYSMDLPLKEFSESSS
jgi:hypothetical protein